MTRGVYLQLGALHIGWITFEGNAHLSVAWLRPPLRRHVQP